MKIIHLVTIFSFLSVSLYAKDFKVEELPFYKIGQLEKEMLYINVAKKFVEAKSSFQASQLIVENSPEEMAAFSKAFKNCHLARTGEVQKDLIIFGFGGNQFAHITMEAGANVQNVCQLVWEQGMESPKVDWRATYGCGEMSWEEFLETQPQLPTMMRVRLVPSLYYNFKYSNEKKWICLKCHHPFLKKEVFAYIERGDAKFKKLMGSLEKSGHVDVTVEMCYPEVIKDRKQVELTKVVHKTWYTKNYHD